MINISAAPQNPAQTSWGGQALCSGDPIPKQSSFSLYLGMAPLDNSSSTYKGLKTAQARLTPVHG
jgi:hypothetical protein